jgi:hypothetical protein
MENCFHPEEPAADIQPGIEWIENRFASLCPWNLTPHLLSMAFWPEYFQRSSLHRRSIAISRSRSADDHNCRLQPSGKAVGTCIAHPRQTPPCTIKVRPLVHEPSASRRFALRSM